jgi:hypothetical protein
MALLLVEGFDHMDNILDWYEGDTTNLSFEGTIVRSTGQSLKITNSAGHVRLRSNTAANPIIFGFGFYLSALPVTTGLVTFAKVMEDRTTVHVLFYVDKDGKISAKRATTVLGTSANACISAETWHYIEIKVKVIDSMSNGDIQVYVDGDLELQIDSGDSRTGANATGLCPALFGTTGFSSYFDDVYVLETTTGENTTFLGPVKVLTLAPTKNGNANQFVGSDSDSTDNYLLVDDATAPDDDTTYVESGTLNELDQYGYVKMVGSTTIFGIGVAAFAKSTLAGGKATMKASVRSGGTDYTPGVELGLPNAYIGVQDVIETDPATTELWVKSGLDNANIGWKVTGT